MSNLRFAVALPLLMLAMPASQPGAAPLPEEQSSKIHDTRKEYADTTADWRTPPDSSSGKQELKVVRRNYEYRKQVGLAVFMMAFVLVALTTTDAFNPD